MMKQTIVAFVPMRHHSQRVPGKNYRELAGKPLFHHIIETLLSCSEVTRIVVDTDSPIILEGLKTDFPGITRQQRPAHLCADDIPMNEILLHDTELYPADFYLQTHSTNPLLRPETISRGIKTLLDHYPTYDSLFGVTRRQIRLWDQLGRPINHNPSILLQTQDLPPVYEENSCMYLFTRDTLVERRNRLGERPFLFEIDPEEAMDIDVELDFTIVDALMKNEKGA